MVDFTITDPVLELKSHLLSELPALERWLRDACAEHEEKPQSQYWLFSYVVRPYVESLLARESHGELAQAWNALERIAASGSASERNELFVTMEELDLWHFHRFMGPTLRAHWIEAITWYPTLKTRTEPMNTHVDQQKFRQRWLQEIEKIGGFDQLTAEQFAGLLADDFSCGKLLPGEIQPVFGDEPLTVERGVIDSNAVRRQPAGAHQGVAGLGDVIRMLTAHRRPAGFPFDPLPDLNFLVSVGENDNMLVD